MEYGVTVELCLMKEINTGIVRQMTETMNIVAVLIAPVDIVKATKNHGRLSTDCFHKCFR